jgi:hypothetical protein
MGNERRSKLGFVLAIASVCASGCATLAMQDDGFRDELARGCRTEQQCQALAERAAERRRSCKDNTIGYVRCDDAAADLRQANALRHRGTNGNASVVADDGESHAEAQARFTRAQQKTDVENRQRGAEVQAAARADYAARKAEQARLTDEARVAREAREEAARQAAADAESARAARRAELDEFASQAKYAVPVASALLCRARHDLEDIQASCAEERRIDRLSGTVNLSERRSCTVDIEASKAVVRRHQETLQRHRARARACGDESRQIIECAGRSERCEEPFGTYAEIIDAGAMQ